MKQTFLISCIILTNSLTAQSWIPQTSATGDDLQSVHFASASVGCACAKSGVVVCTSDGGWTWVQKAGPTFGGAGSLNSIFLPTTTNGYAMGYLGNVKAAKSNGLNYWKPTSYPGGFYGIYFHSTLDGITVGSNGKIHKTNDGADTFTLVPTTFTNQLNAVTFVTSLEGWSVGNGGIIVHTTDGGATWTQQTSPTSLDLFSVAFTSNLIGFAVGSVGTLIKTTDGGATWISQSSGTTKELTGISFANNQKGCIVGKSLITLMTSDGGNTWTPEPTTMLGNAYGIFYHSSGVAWAVGAGGGILTYNNTVGINEHEWSKNVSIFPVPARSEVKIKSEFRFSSFSIVTCIGETIKSGAISENRLNLENIACGVYFLRLITFDNRVISKKLIVE